MTYDSRRQEAVSAALSWLTAAHEHEWVDDDVIHSFGVTVYGEKPVVITVGDLRALLPPAIRAGEPQ